MSRPVTTAAGLGLLDGDGTGVLLDLPHPDLGRALEAGLTQADIAAAEVRGASRSRRRSDPVIFLKAPSPVTATGQAIRLPHAAPHEVDYAGELGIVIGRRLTGVDVTEARRGIAGCTVCDDVSARDARKGRVPGRKADVSAARSFKTLTPMGPCLATLDEFDDSDDPRLRTWVDGELRQDARTSDLIHPAVAIVSYLSAQTTLRPGDVILIGTHDRSTGSMR